MTENQQQPKVSAVITSYNYEDYIGEAIESVIAQTYQNWELVVVDDASTDRSVEIISQYQEKYPDQIKLIALSENRGVGYVANLGIENSTGEYIANLGSDDLMMPERLEKQVAYFLENPKVGVVCSDVFVINGDGAMVECETVFSKPVTDLRMQLLEGNFINSPSATFKRCIHYEVGKFNPVLDYVQDFDHWLRVLDKHDIERIPEKLTAYRVHGKNLSVQQNAGELTYAGSYESFIAILRAIKRRDIRLSKDALPIQQLIQEKLDLAKAAMKAEQRFLGTFKYAVTTVYCLVLDVMELDNHNEQAKSLLDSVYTALGDEPRAIGEKPITVEAFQLSDKSDRKPPHVTALHAYNHTGMPISEVTKSMLDNKNELFPSDIEKESFILKTARGLYKELRQKAEVDQNDSTKLNYSFREGMKNIKGLFHSNLKHQLHAESVEFLNEVNDWNTQQEYKIWIKSHALLAIDAEVMAERMLTDWAFQPTLHCILFLLPGEEPLLANTIDSLAAQFYSQWHFTVIALTDMPDPIFEQFDNLQWIKMQESDSAFELLNQALKEQSSDWSVFIEPGIQFEVHTLLKVAEYINLHPEWSYIYTDDDRIDLGGNRMQPRFKPEFNLDLLRSSPYIGMGWMKTSNLLNLGGVQAIPGAEHYDLALRWIDEFGEEAVGHISDVLVHVPSESQRPFDSTSGLTVLQQHLARNAIKANIHQGYLDHSYRIEYLHETTPLVSIIIPTKDKLEYFQPCIESVLEKTTYSNFEVIVIDNDSSSPDTLSFYDELRDKFSDKVKVLFYDKPFNFSAINNWGAENASGDYILMLNNDTQVVQPEWLSILVSYGQRTEVGAVGARLVYPTTGKVQHVGVVLGLSNTAAHPYNQQLTMDEPGYMGRALLDQNYSAVTAAVMLVKRELYIQTGGMNEQQLAVLYNDMDLCLKIGEAGYKIVWTPYAMVVHHAGTSLKNNNPPSLMHYDYLADAAKQDRSQKERRYFLQQWLPKLANDPAYNKNLSLTEGFSIEQNAIPNWDVNFSSRPHYFGRAVAGGSGEYRMKQPFAALREAGIAQCEVSNQAHLSVTELARLQPDTYLYQNCIDDSHIEILRLHSDWCPQVGRVLLIDDLMHDLPEKNSFYRELKSRYRDAKSRMRKTLGYSDRLIVTTQPLADLCSDMIDDIHIIPNRLQREDWCNLTSLRNQSTKLRVGWAGAHQHLGDLELITDVVKQTAEEVDWIFFGMCPDEIKPFIKEFHESVNIDVYPEKLASLNLDLAVAPLEIHPFNEAKSNLRLLEYGILAWPVICTDIFPYRSNAAPVTRLQNETQLWVNGIRAAIAEPDLLEQQGKELRNWVLDNYILEDHLDEWANALKVQK